MAIFWFAEKFMLFGGVKTFRNPVNNELKAVFYTGYE
jgi:hypothetical protein